MKSPSIRISAWISFAAALIILWLFLLRNLPATQEGNKDPIRFGVLLSLTGTGANYGQRSLHGVQWAVSQINDAGGVNGRKLEAVVEDSRSDPKDAVSAFQRLSNVEGVNLVIGDVISGTTLAVAPIAESQHVLLLAPGASSPKMRGIGEYVFRNWTSDDFDGKVMARYLRSIHVEKLALLVEKTEYTEGIATSLETEFKRLGGRVVVSDAFASDSTDLKPQLLKIKGAKVDSVYLSAYSTGTGLALRQSREMGLPLRWFTTLTVDTPEAAKIAGESRNGTVFTTPAFDVNDTSSHVKKFVGGFKLRFKDEPEIAAAHGYDAVRILATAIESAGPSPDELKLALPKIKDFPGVTGLTTFDEKGDVVKGVLIKKIVLGQPTLIKAISPSELSK